VQDVADLPFFRRMLENTSRFTFRYRNVLFEIFQPLPHELPQFGG